MVEEKTIISVLFNLAILFIMFLMRKKMMNSTYSSNRVNRCLFIVLIFTFCLFSFWGGDWFHYQSGFNNVSEMQHIEPIYYWLFEHVPSYISFRFIVWGSALLFVLLTIKKTSVDYDKALCYFAMSSLIWFSYARVSLSFAIMFFGLALIANSKKRILERLFGLALIIVSFYFHKSAFFGITALIISLIIARTSSKLSLPILILSFIVFYFVVRYNLNNLLEVSMETDNEIIGEYANSGSRYLEKGVEFGSKAAVVLRVLEMVVYVLEVIMALLLLTGSKRLFLSYNIKCFAWSIVFIFLFSLTVAMVIGQFFGTIHIRFLRFSIIPSIIVFSFAYRNGFYLKYNMVVFNICCISTFAHVLYSLYCTL